jgi:hypothetical protein
MREHLISTVHTWVHNVASDIRSSHHHIIEAGNELTVQCKILGKIDDYSTVQYSTVQYSTIFLHDEKQSEIQNGNREKRDSLDGNFRPKHKAQAKNGEWSDFQFLSRPLP